MLRLYLPHLTLGRVRGRPVGFDASGVRAPTLRFMVGGMDLVKSAPGDGGATYSSLSAYPLESGDQGSDGHDDEEEYQDHNDYAYEVTPAHPIRTPTLVAVCRIILAATGAAASECSGGSELVGVEHPPLRRR
jgi:hypothetical protein